MSTEDVDPRFTDLDDWPLVSVMDAIWESQLSAVATVKNALPEITKATAASADALGDDGRIVYVGAGTSIRVAVQDGSELPPTFNWPMQRIKFVIAGGERALIESQEGAEDDEDDARQQIDSLQLTPSDVVIGVAASGTTPFTVAALKKAEDGGAVSIGVANNFNAPLLQAVSHPICIQTGSEVVAGSTRMKAGTSQKVVLNMISTGIMIRLGRIYKGLMVDMQAANIKLEKRAIEMVSNIAECDIQTADGALKSADGDIKLASLIAMGCDVSKGRGFLQQSQSNLRKAIKLASGDRRGD